MEYILKYSDFTQISEGLQWHFDNKIPLSDPIYRVGSSKWHSLIDECKSLYSNGMDFGNDNFILHSDIGEAGIYEGVEVLLDIPFIDQDVINEEAEYKGREVSLNKPFRSTGPKKYAVYVRSPKTGRTIKVNFGDVKGGLTSKISDPDARKRFASRHKCHDKRDKTKPGYWSCNLPRYGKLLGLSKNMNTFW